jgi:soluble lytic murein transglycosylase-like protein
VLVPAFVPAPYRRAILAASLRTGVPAPLLAAQIKSESNFDPRAVSPAGALGIAQFMPSTAASRGLRDPFDPFASIRAQADLMAELIAEFGSTRLALAAYNAGPGAVGACGCVPPFSETIGYVARVLSLAGGAAGSIGLPMEVALID